MTSGRGDIEQLVAALEIGPTEVVGRELRRLQRRPGRSVEYDDTIAYGGNVVLHGRRLPRFDP